jgi:hypothetical protein
MISNTLGNIVVIKTVTNKKPFIEKENRAKAYAARTEITVANTTVDKATIKLLEKYLKKLVKLKRDT